MNKIPREWVLLEDFNNPNGLWGRFWWLPIRVQKNQKKHWLEHIAQSRHYNTQQWVESQQQFHHFFNGSASWFKYEELIEDWLDLTVFEETKRGPALKSRLVGDAEMYKGLLNRESLSATDGVKYFRNTFTLHFIKGSSECVLLEILSVQSSMKRKFRNGHVDRQVFTVFEAFKRRLDGQLADVRTEWRTNTKSVFYRRGPRKCRNRIVRWDGFGSEHTRKPRKVEYCTSEYPRKSLSIQRQLDNIDVYCRKWFDRSPERDWQVPFLLREWISLLILLKMRGQHFWNYFCKPKSSM